jgi:hypothetical protein
MLKKQYIPENNGMTDNENIDFYKLVYRNYKSDCLKMSIDTNAQYIPEGTVKMINKILSDIKTIEPKYSDKKAFSDAVYTKIPVFDKKTNILMTYDYVPIFAIRNKGDPNDYIKRFIRFNINNLPLIEVANYLNIKVEKANNMKEYGIYNSDERKIVMGTDYEPVFTHELAHAIDFSFLPSFEYEFHYNEIIAELSTIVLCKTYNIPIDIPFSLYYLEAHSYLKSNLHKAINRVALIYETIEECKTNIKSKKNEAQRDRFTLRGPAPRAPFQQRNPGLASYI